MNAADYIAGVVTELKTWAKQPFNQEMDLMHWALFVGVIIVLAILWKMVLGDIKSTLE